MGIGDDFHEKKKENHRKTTGKWWFNGVYVFYALVMTNIAMENPRTKWRLKAGNIIFINGSFSMAMLNNQMVLVITGHKMGSYSL